jgi:GNAT superfamily N-acetyltransferase
MAAALAERDGNTCTLVAVDERDASRAVIGTCSVVLMRRIARGGCMVARLEDVVTGKAARGRGVAAALCEAAKEEAAKRGAYAIDLRCVPKLTKYYGKFGWAEAGCAMRCKL